MGCRFMQLVNPEILSILSKLLRFISGFWIFEDEDEDEDEDDLAGDQTSKASSTRRCCSWVWTALEPAAGLALRSRPA